MQPLLPPCPVCFRKPPHPPCFQLRVNTQLNAVRQPAGEPAGGPAVGPADVAWWRRHSGLLPRYSSALSSCLSPPSAPTAGLTGGPADSSLQLPVMRCPSKYTSGPRWRSHCSHWDWTSLLCCSHPRCLTLCLFCQEGPELHFVRLLCHTDTEIRRHLLQNIIFYDLEFIFFFFLLTFVSLFIFNAGLLFLFRLMISFILSFCFSY